MKNFASESSIHGVNYIFGENRSKFVRFFWIFLLLGSACGLSYYIINSYRRWQIIPDIAMRREERSTVDFPMPAITFCPRLFAKNNLANYSRVFNEQSMKITSKSECEFTAANMNWCEPFLMDKVTSVCGDFLIELDKIDVLDLINKSALNRSEILNRDFYFLKIFTNRGICYTMNMQDSSAIFNDHILHDDFQCFKNQKNPEFEWTVERRYFTKNATYPMHFISRGDFYIQLKINSKDGDNSCGSIYMFMHLPSEIPTAFHEFIPIGYGSKTSIVLSAKSHRTDNALRDFSPEIRNCYFEGEKS